MRSGEVYYAAAMQDGIQIFQINGSSLLWQGSAETPDSARSLTVYGNNAYVACGDSGVAVFDLSSPYLPNPLITVDTPGFAKRVSVSGERAWVADKERGITVLDVSDPASAAIIANLPTQDEALGAAVNENILYVADRDAGLTIYDVTNLSVPIILGGVTMPDEAVDVLFVDQYALVAAFEAGLRVVDVSDPSTAEEIASLDLPGHAERVVTDGQWVYVALHDKGMAVVDLSDPENPILNAYQESPGSAVDISINDDRIIIADTYCIGVYAFDPTGIEEKPTKNFPDQFNLTAYPNPFNSTALFTFTLPTASNVRFDIFNLRGESVGSRIKAFPLSERLNPGVHQFAIDAFGLPSGIYFLHLQTETKQISQKIVLLK
jgi:hypothetical protein